MVETVTLYNYLCGLCQIVSCPCDIDGPGLGVYADKLSAYFDKIILSKYVVLDCTCHID